MAFTGRRQAALDEIDEDKEANLDRWVRSQLPGEEAATKALDELRLTPNPTDFLCPALVNALDPNDSKNYDAELRRAWLRLNKQTRRGIWEVKICAACGYSLPEAAFTKKQWSWKSPKLVERRRCIKCVCSGRVVGGRRDW